MIDKASPFSGKSSPDITIYDYLHRVQQYARCSNSCYILSLIYIDRLLLKDPEFVLNRKNIYRVIITSLLLAIKYSEDFYYQNSFYSSIGGISVRELNQLETAMLFRLRFDLNVSEETYTHYIDDLKSHFIQLVCEELSAASPEREVLGENLAFPRT